MLMLKSDTEWHLTHSMHSFQHGIRSPHICQFEMWDDSLFLSLLLSRSLPPNPIMDT